MVFLQVMNKIAVAGAFDPIHEGHIDHLEKAAKLKGLYGTLVVILARDDQLIMKKGFCFHNYTTRCKILSHMDMVDEVAVNIDKDTSCANTLRLLKPTIFANGGDRTEGNMPKSEIDACNDIGCKIVYGVGDLLNSSSELVERAARKMFLESKESK